MYSQCTCFAGQPKSCTPQCFAALLLLYARFAAALHMLFNAALLLLYCCFTAFLLLLYCCFTADPSVLCRVVTCVLPAAADFTRSKAAVKQK
jgi:hypothetical protein